MAEMKSGLSDHQLQILAREHASEEDFWWGKLNQVGEWTEAPLGGGGTEKKLRVGLPGNFVDRLQQVGGKNDGRVFIVAMAVFSMWSAFKLQKRKLVIGVPCAQAANPMLPLAIELSADSSFRTFLGTVRSALVSAFQHEHFPLELLSPRLPWAIPNGAWPYSGMAFSYSALHQNFNPSSAVCGIALVREGEEMFLEVSGGAGEEEAKQLANEMAVLGMVAFQHPQWRLPMILSEWLSGRRKMPFSAPHRRMYALHGLDPASTAYNVPHAFRLSSPISHAQLQKAAYSLWARHPGLRCGYAAEGGEMVQYVSENASLEVEMIECSEGEIAGKLVELIRPFDLDAPPLLRLALLQQPSGAQVIFLDFAHILSDLRTPFIFLEELLLLCKGSELSDSPIPISALAFLEDFSFLDGNLESDLSYWKSAFADHIGEFALPTDFPRPPKMSFEGATLNQSLPPDLTSALRRFAKAKKLRLFDILLSTFSILLHRHTGLEDFVIGLPVDVPPENDLRNVIGNFSNTLPLRLQMKAGDHFEQVLNKVRTQVQAGTAHSKTDLETILHFLGLTSEGQRNPLFDVLFWEQTGLLEFAGIELKPVLFENPKAEIDLAMYFTDFGGELVLSFEYSTALFRKETIEGMAGHLERLLRAVAEESGEEIGKMNILGEAEREKLLGEFQSEKVVVEPLAMAQLFESRVDRDPNARALTWGVGEEMTYGELEGKANQLAHFLRDERQVGPGKIVGLCLERSSEMMVAILAVHKAGGAYLPISPDYPEDRIRAILDDAAVDTVVSTADQVKLMNRLQWDCPALAAFICLDSEDVHYEAERDPNYLADPALWEYFQSESTDEITGGGFVSSYTGEDISREEADEFIANTFLKIRPYLNAEATVVELGCGGGLTMYEVAPHCGRYIGTDFSKVMIEKHRERIAREGLENVAVAAIAADEIGQLACSEVDLVIVNSVVQSFQGHNYLRQVIRETIKVMRDGGAIFLGDIMDAGLKEALLDSLRTYQNDHRNPNTKTDFSSELFVARQFWEDLQFDFPELARVEVTEKVHTISNEHTDFRYDVVLHVDRKADGGGEGQRNKLQFGATSWRNRSTERLPASATVDDLAYVLYTSGSTGTPKGVMIRQSSIFDHIRWFSSYFQLNSETVFLQKTPYTFDVSVWELFAWMYTGSQLVLLPPGAEKDPALIHAHLERHAVNIVHFVPSMLGAYLNWAGRQADFNGHRALKSLVCSGEALLPALAADFQELLHDRSPVRLYNLYGPTEATVDVTAFPIPLGVSPDHIPIGRPTENHSIYILDKQGELLPPGVPGELCIAGSGVAQGYLNRPKLTQERFQPCPFAEGLMYKTGDLARWLPDGNLDFLGRIDHQVKIRGFRIEPGEIEKRLLEQSFVKEVAVVPREDADGERILVAYYVSELNMDLGILRAELLKKLPDYMVPAYFVRLVKMPHTVSGKVDKKALPRSLSDKESGDGNYEAPRYFIERRLAEIWADVLKTDRPVGLNDNFFQLGGHSLKAIQVKSLVHEQLEFDLPLGEVLKLPTVRECAAYIREHLGEDEVEALSGVETAKNHPVSRAQQRMFVLTNMDSRSLSYNIPAVFRLDRPVDKERLTHSLNQLIVRHSSLRTRFYFEGDELRQEVQEKAVLKLEVVEAEENERDKSVSAFVRPFDLGMAPLMRAQVLRVKGESEYLLIDIHHIVADATSVGVLLQEFAALYGGETLPAVRTQYLDYIYWSISKVDSVEMDRDEAYWMTAFKELPPPMTMPLDFPRPEVWEFNGEEMSFEADPELTAAIKSLAVAHESTLYMTLLAVYFVLLRCYTGQEDLVVGFPINGRTHSAFDATVGMFVNTLALRNRPESRKRFGEFLIEVRNNSLEAFDRQGLQFDDLVEALAIPADPSRNPLFDTMFAMGGGKITSFELGEVRADRLPLDYGVAKFDVSMEAHEENGKLVFWMDYRVKLFKRSTMEAFAADYLALFRLLCRQPDIQIGEIQLEKP